MSKKVNSKNKTTNIEQEVPDAAQTPENQSPNKGAGPITTKIRELEKKIKAEQKAPRPVKGGGMGNALREKAMAVILKEPRSKEWDDYMKLFGFSEDEIKQLVPGEDLGKNEALAYLIGGGVCGGSSVDLPGPGLFGKVFEEDDPDAIERP